ncbi:COMM domain-containing protein 2 [Dermatophagoides pteronyssinus]|uniref:COMM domain-containing protein 2 n=1 Tax=Dermatophagoides pteronyssinus TaxID=6956 RepID=A0ABQ8J3B3_DERPT|nr:COMM domain-containing protein 2 [Dermatophagoides pteronyssinus]
MLETEEFKCQIRQLDSCNNQEIDSICKSCLDFLHSHSKSIDNENIDLIRSLSTFIIQAIKFQLNENDFQQRLLSMNCNEYFIEQFTKFYQQIAESNVIESALIKRSFIASNYNYYNHLRWRFEIKLSSKYCREKFQPNILLNFFVKNSEQNQQMKRIQVNCSIADIIYIYKKITEIIESNNSFYCTKLLKNIKL